MNKGLLNKIKLLITIVLVLVFVWFLVISPMISFHDCESRLEEAARRYFELNSSELPSGENVKTLSLKTLYKKSFIKKDLFIPYTKKTCSVENSWVKVRRVDGEYKYYTYLECGVLSSTIDHKGPVITLKGETSMTVGKGEEYNELGVKSVVDNTDGKLDVNDVKISGEVDTSKIGTYEITYTAYDNLRNKSVVTREVKVVQKLNSTIKTKLGDAKNFTGSPTDNYVRLSNMVFRIYGVDGDNNVIIVSSENIANVNYTKLDKWLDYYYDNLNDFTKSIIVKAKYCNMDVTDTNVTKCTKYTEARNVYIPSIVEVNKAADGYKNYMRPTTISWVANKKDSKTAYITKNMFSGDERTKTFLAFDIKENNGVRPMMTIKGSTLITDGDGTRDNPYVFGDVKRAKGATPVNERYTGEYISIDGQIYRIVKTLSDGTTKVISNFTIGSDRNPVSSANAAGTYNPKDSSSVGYFINNKVSGYINTKYFAKHEIEVPIYKSNIVYGEEVETKKYETLLSAPNMYEMFSAQPQGSGCSSYWLINSSKKEGIVGGILLPGVPLNEEVDSTFELRVRVVAFVKKGTTISSGDGTIAKPYIIK